MFKGTVVAAAANDADGRDSDYVPIHRVPWGRGYAVGRYVETLK